MLIVPKNTQIWHRFWAGGVVGSHFFDNDIGLGLIVTCKHYIPELNDELVPMDTKAIWL